MEWERGKQSNSDSSEKSGGAITVTAALRRAQSSLEKIRVTVIGEVSEFNDKPGYKAAYFTIRDESSALPCRMWRNRFNAAGVKLQVGMKIEVRGFFTLYAAKGNMQFNVESLRPAGEGDLRIKVDMLARKLKAEGLMDVDKKRAVPEFAQRVAVVTSPRGKAIHDVLRTLRRRNPLVEVGIAGVPVEGVKAHEYLIQGLRAAFVWRPDVILLVRGGGSYEDLMPFNDEQLARAIFACPIPIVTGIGHEPDTTIADMVSDRRASTPTAAAESVAPSSVELLSMLETHQTRLNSALRDRLTKARQWLESELSRPAIANPWRDLERYSQHILLSEDRLTRSMPLLIESMKNNLSQAEQRFYRAIPGSLERDKTTYKRLEERLLARADSLLVPYTNALSVAAGKLNSLSPLKILSRGYAVVHQPKTGAIVDSIHAVEPGDRVALTVSDGEIDAQVLNARDSQTLIENGETDERTN